jgi:hypothetical protein
MRQGPTYSAGTDEDTIWLEDADSGGMSLTNGMETALSQLLANGFDIKPETKLVYRDSEGSWDGVRVTSTRPMIISFIGLGASSRQEAIKLIKQNV